MNLEITKVWLKMIWPFWLVQFLVLIISSGPSNLKLWFGIVVLFNALAFWLAVDSVRFKRRLDHNLELLDEAIKKHEQDKTEGQ